MRSETDREKSSQFLLPRWNSSMNIFVGFKMKLNLLLSFWFVSWCTCQRDIHYGPLWSRTAKNPDVSTAPLAHPFARAAHSFACSALLILLAHSFLRWLLHSWARGKVDVNAGTLGCSEPWCIRNLHERLFWSGFSLGAQMIIFLICIVYHFKLMREPSFFWLMALTKVWSKSQKTYHCCVFFRLYKMDESTETRIWTKLF